MFISVAAGNSYNTSGEGLNILAASHSVAAVGAVWDDNVGGVVFSNGAIDYSTAADRVASFSQRSAELDLLAPGGDILSLAAGGGVRVFNGTSMSAPLVAGAAVLLREAADRLGIAITPQGMLQVLRDSAHWVYDGDDEDDNVPNSNRSYPRIDVGSALAALLANPLAYRAGGTQSVSVGAGALLGNLQITAQIDGVPTVTALVGGSQATVSAAPLDPPTAAPSSPLDQLWDEIGEEDGALFDSQVDPAFAAATPRFAGHNHDGNHSRVTRNTQLLDELFAEVDFSDFEQDSDWTLDPQDV